MKKPNAITVVIPARNEQDTISTVISKVLVCPFVDEVVVVNNGSTDDTANLASIAGARVIDEPTPGFGKALKTGYKASRNNWIVKLDADLSVFSSNLVEILRGELQQGTGLVKGRWHDPNDNMPMTRLMIKPALEIMFPGLSHISAVNSGLFLFNKSYIAIDELTEGYGADIDIMLRMHAAGWQSVETDIGEIANNPRCLTHYNDMAEALLRFLIQRHKQAAQNSLVVVAESANDIIRSSLGVIIKKLQTGGRVIAIMDEKDIQANNLLAISLTSYPTFSMMPISEVEKFNIVTAHQNATVITNYFNHVADTSDPIVKAALTIQGKFIHGGEKATLLMMPISKSGIPAAEFRPDVRVDVTKQGEQVKLIQDQLTNYCNTETELQNGQVVSHDSWRGLFNPDEVESFQAYDHKDIAPPFTII